MLLLAGACAPPADAPDGAHPLAREAAALLADDRPFDARLSGSRRWAPCRGDTARLRASARCAPLSPETLEATARLAPRIRAASGTSVDASWAGALVDLASAPDRAVALDRSVARLDAVATAEPRSAAAANDAAVAALVHAAGRDDAWSLFAALDHVERAARADSASDVVAFNRAVVAERLHLQHEAVAAWDAFLARDGASEWAGEARRRRGEGAPARAPHGGPTGGARAARDPRGWRDAVRADPQRARELVLDSLLPAWARAQLADGARADASALDAARETGRELLRLSGDSSVLHVVAECERARPDAGARRALLHGLVALADGAHAFAVADFARAQGALDASAARLATAGARSLEDWATLLLAALDIYQADYTGADRRYARLAHDARRRGELALEARATWGLALSLARQARTSAAAERFDAAARLFARLGERANEGVMRSQLGDQLHFLGQDDAALAAKLRALDAMRGRGTPEARHALLLDLGQQLADRGLSSAAVAVLREAVRAAGDSHRPKDRPEALLRLAEAEAADARGADARTHLAAASAALLGVDDTLMRARLRAELAVTEASALEGTVPRLAESRLGEAEGYFRRSRLPVARARVLLQRGRLRARTADTSGASRDLADAVAILESQSAGAMDGRAGRDAAAVRRSALKELVAIAVARGDTARAYAFAERSRSRGPRPADERDASRARDVPGVVVLSFVVLHDETVVWITARGHRRMLRVPVRADSLNALVDRVEDGVRSGVEADGPSRAAHALHALLVAPAEPELRGARELVLVTDAQLGRLPFAALLDTRGRWLVEQFALRHAATTGGALAATDEPARVGDGDRVLVVSDPAFDRAAFRELDVLRDVEREVPAIVALHPSATVIRGGDATKRAVVRALPRATLFHFAGHARLVERAPAASHLVLADDGGVGGSTLTAAEIERLSLPRLRLAILSACGTTQRRARGDDVEGGLPQALLDAGAHGVVSSLWEADDAGTAALMGELHRALARGVTSAQALRDAQLQMIAFDRSPRASRTWAAFRYTRG